MNQRTISPMILALGLLGQMFLSQNGHAQSREKSFERAKGFYFPFLSHLSINPFSGDPVIKTPSAFVILIEEANIQERARVFKEAIQRSPRRRGSFCK